MVETVTRFRVTAATLSVPLCPKCMVDIWEAASEIAAASSLSAFRRDKESAAKIASPRKAIC